MERGDNDVEDIDDLTDLMELDQTNDSAYDSFSTGVLGNNYNSVCIHCVVTCVFQHGK